MFVYTVWEELIPFDNDCLLEIFENEEDANKYADKISDENYTSCRVMPWNLK